MLLVQTLPSSLNSRKSLDNEGIKVFGLDSVAERNFIARAQRFAVAERYNAPQVTFYVSRCPDENVFSLQNTKLPECQPARIDIKVATEIEGEGEGDNHTSQGSVLDEGKVFRV